MEVDPIPSSALAGNPLTSTTAPGKTFTTRSELAQHYKSDWHRYNLKRREAGLPMLREADFQARLDAALALRKEREQREERSGTGHLKQGGGGKGGKNKGKKDKKKNSKKEKNEQRKAKHEDDNTSDAEQAQQAETVNDDNKMDEDQPESSTGGGEDPTPAIDPCQSLFDNTLHRSPAASLSYMSQKYGFFLPDVEYCIDLEGLLGYCQEKVKLGHYCLYCQRIYKTWSGCQKHMIDANHCKLRYERGIDQEEFDVFYDFSEANAEFLGNGGKGKKEEGEVVYEDDMDEEDGEWEDISDDEMGDEDEDMEGAEDDDYQEYEHELKTHGFDITPLGELIFPDGRIIGHRGLSRYYKQRFAPDGERAAVTAARRAAGERVYAGRVHQIGGPAAAAAGGTGGGDNNREATLALAKAGLVAGAAAGRSGRGILVPTSGTSGGGGSGGAGSFTALSLYRYKTAVKKSRREEAKGHRLQQRTKMNINRMDKKANRLMNGVSVAHAAR